MKIEPVPLFSSTNELLFLLLGILVVFVFSLGNEYGAYKELTRFSDAELDATVLDQYEKRRGDRTYQLLKLRTVEQGAVLYMPVDASIRELRGYRIRVWLRTEALSFPDFLKGTYASGYVTAVYPDKLKKYRAAESIASQHGDGEAGALFAAMFVASPLPPQTRERIAALGISHLLAISGFHIGLLSLLLFWGLRYPYRMLQSRRFPWRNAKRDLFVLSAAMMFFYVVFLEMTPSVMRAYAMMLIGFILYDRGIRLLTFQSLLLAVLLLLALWPRLMFSLGLWLSVAGVFYIFMFLKRFELRGKRFKFIGIHVWVYMMMLPITLGVFGTFSSWHPLSMLWTMLFTLFYPVALGLHLCGLGGLLDGVLGYVMALPAKPVIFDVGPYLLPVWIALSLLVLVSETVERLLPYLAAAVFVGAVYQIT